MRSLDEHLVQPSLGDPPCADDVTEGCAGGSCGVLARFYLEVEEGIITECTARVRGRAAAFAAASSFCELARGRDVLDAARLGLTTMHPSFAKMSADDRERALVVEDAFHHAIGNWFLARAHEAGPGAGRERPAICSPLPPPRRAGVVVGMSGGVDSAIALHRMLDEHGDRAAGATLRLWIDPRSPDPDAACCSPDSVRRARATCHAAGAPHLSLDLRSSFARGVVGPFVASYAAGETPNPCVRCNGTFRIDELVRIADVAGAPLVATGHYVRSVPRGDGTALVRRGLDPTKDQSYMLSTLDPVTVARCTFPLGSSLKVDVREDAAARGLAQATIGDSQEVCFLGGGDYRTFLGRAGALGAPGEIVLDHAGGRVLAHHDGVARFTRGQRRGIGVTRPGSGAGASPAPLFVLDVDPDTGRVVVGDAAGLDEGRVGLRGVRWHVEDRPGRVEVQLRYRHRGGAAPASVVEATTGSPESAVDLVFDEPVRAPAPGQVAVLYDTRGVVLGAGTIVRLAPGSAPARAHAPASVDAPVLARGRRAR